MLNSRTHRSEPFAHRLIMPFERRIDLTPMISMRAPAAAAPPEDPKAKASPPPIFPEPIEKAIAEAADAFGLQIRREKDRWVLNGGSHFSVNPSAPGVRVAVTLESSEVKLVAEPIAFPWTRRKVERLVEAWLGTFEANLRERIKGEASPPTRRMLTAAPDGPGAVFAALGMLVAVALCGLLTLAATTALGIVIVDRQVEELRQRSELISSLNVVPIPSRTELASFGTGRHVGAALLLALPGAFFATLALGVCLMLSEGFVRCQRLGLWAYLFLVIFLTLTLVPATDIVAAPAFALAIPTAGVFGYTFVWSRRREYVDERTAEARSASAKRRRFQMAMVIVGVGIVAASVAPWRAKGGADTLEELARFRDLYLLPTAAGKAFAEYYYRHTPYGTEPLMPIINDAPVEEGGHWERDQRTALLLTDDTAIRHELVKEGFTVMMTSDPRRFEAEMRQPYDVIIAIAWEYPKLPEDMDTYEDSRAVKAIREAGIESRTLLLGEHNKGTPLGFAPDQIVHVPAGMKRPPVEPVCACFGAEGQSPRLIRVLSNFLKARHRGDHLSAWIGYGWKAITYAGGLAALAVVLLPPAALFALLFRRASRRTATAVTALACLGSLAGLWAVTASGAEARRAVAELRGLDVAGEGTRDKVIEALKSPHAVVRYEAAHAAHAHLASIGENVQRLRLAQEHAGFYQALVAGLKDPDLRVRLWSAGALGKLKSEEAIDPLIAALDDPELLVRYRAAGALGDIGDRDAVEALLDVMAHDAWYAGRYALGALREIAPDEY